MLTGGCHCGAIRYEATAAPTRHALCHCADCRKSAGAPVVGWAKVRSSSEHGRRHFCPDCGAGLFYTNDVIFVGVIDVQSATLDDPDAIMPPMAQIQVAERIGWMKDAHLLPHFERYTAS